MTERAIYKPIVTGGTFSQTISQTASALTVPSDAKRLVFQVENEPIRVTFNGDTPVAGVGGGLLYTAGSDYVIDGWDSISGMKMVRDGSTSSRITGQFFTKE